MQNSSLCATHSLLEVAHFLHQRKMSPSEVVQDALNRIAQFDSTIRACTEVTEALALETAKILDAEWSRGELRGPLHGIPLTYKDNIAVAGLRCTANSRSRANWIPDTNAEVVNRLNAAGGVTVAKVTLWELAGAPPTDDALFPSPRNPWNLDYTAGGSSSGSGAAVAAGFGLGSIGTDTGGSVRYPAASCGLVGCKPTLGRVSTEGVIPLSPTLDHVGPLTRTVGDNLVLLGAMLTHNELSPTLWPQLLNEPQRLRELGIRGLRIGVPRHTLARFDYTDACRQAFERSLTVLRELGAEILDVNLEFLDEASVMGGEITAMDAAEQHGAHMQANPELYQSSFHTRLELAKKIDAQRRAELRQARARCIDALLNMPVPVDVIVTPGAGTTADSFETMQTPGYGPKAEYTRMYSVAGMPALVLPMGKDPNNNMPLSLQFAAHPYREDLIYRAALAYEEATACTKERPPFCSQEKNLENPS